MDWNRRWAKKRGLSSVEGHEAGARNIRRIIESAIKNNIEILSVWAMSSDNFKKRSSLEINWLFSLLANFRYYLEEELYNKVKVDFVWDLDALPSKTKKILETIKEETKNNTEITFVVAFNYWGKEEIIRWIKKFVKAWLDIDSLNEDNFADYIESMKYPPCNVIVRTGWDIRHSGYFLYSSTYSEYYFSDKYWPDFSHDDMDDVMAFYAWAKRNFGK